MHDMLYSHLCKPCTTSVSLGFFFLTLLAWDFFFHCATWRKKKKQTNQQLPNMSQ